MPTPKLTPFDGREVLNTTVAIRNAGDGLSKAMEIDPIELHHGDSVYVVLECEVEKLRFDPIKDTQALSRVHMLKAGVATLVDEALVADALDAQRRAIEEAAGVQRLPLGEPGDTEDDEDEVLEGMER